MKKETYEKLEMEVVQFNGADVITTSGSACYGPTISDQELEGGTW